MKPLNQKNYGSIPHLPNSRLGGGDHSIEKGQADICTKKVRDGYDLIIVQEKLDGSNVGVTKVNGEIKALTRAGYEANTSPYRQHHMFKNYVYQNYDRFYGVLDEGERIVGEWLIQAHGTRYLLKHEPFVAFDLFDTNNNRINYHTFLKRVLPHNFIIPNLIHMGGSISVEKATKKLYSNNGGHNALELPEGLIYRCERKDEVDFLCKWVHHDKEDGKYFPQISGNSEVWNSDPLRYLSILYKGSWSKEEKYDLGNVVHFDKDYWISRKDNNGDHITSTTWTKYTHKFEITGNE